MCSSTDTVQVMKATDLHNHNLYVEGMPDNMTWQGCNNCGHNFTTGYWNEAGMAAILAQSPQGQETSVAKMEGERVLASQIIKRIDSFVDLRGQWLDVGFGSGSLLMTAKEYGYEPVGIDLRQSCVDKVVDYIFNVSTKNFLSFSGEAEYSIVSMSDVLEHIPFPKTFLSVAHNILSPGGILFLSMPNLSSPMFEYLTAHNENPYWAEIEHFHNFSMERLCFLLEEHGFEPLDYNVSQRYRAGMEIIARKST